VSIPADTNQSAEPETPTGQAAFAAAEACFATIEGWLAGDDSNGLEHAELEQQLGARGRELLRLLFQDHVDLRALREGRLEVADVNGTYRTRVETGHDRGLATIFGEVTVTRLAYRAVGQANLHPADAVLNLPVQKHSHGLRQLAAIESSRGSFEGAVDAIERASGQHLGKRQVEDLAGLAAVDFEAFYLQRPALTGVLTDLLVLQVDGKGIVMRSDALRPATAKAAAQESHKLSGRLSKGEKRNRKRMAELGAVYDATPAPRAACDIFPANDTERQAAQDGPAATSKWLVASVVQDAATVIARVFDEAERRDPTHTRDWVALVDGNVHQINRIKAEAAARDITVVIVIDLIHVVEYLWKATWSLHPEADPTAEQWVRSQTLAVLAGDALNVAATIRDQASEADLSRAQRKGADEAATYLTSKAPYLDYPKALASGWPIATGVIEGACRHIVADRFDVTGARWSLAGAEAILKLRALRSNGDWDNYWTWHLAQERRRVHETRYLHSSLPRAA
jgi:hypothetical protein